MRCGQGRLRCRGELRPPLVPHRLRWHRRRHSLLLLLLLLLIMIQILLLLLLLLVMIIMINVIIVVVIILIVMIIIRTKIYNYQASSCQRHRRLSQNKSASRDLRRGVFHRRWFHDTRFRSTQHGKQHCRSNQRMGCAWHQSGRCALQCQNAQHFQHF